MNDDAISRSSTLEHIQRLDHLAKLPDGDFVVRLSEVEDAIINGLPAQQWIPCSEKPITPGLYIVTLKDEKGLFTDTAEWNPTFGGRWQSVFYDVEYYDISNVIAWQPLPAPYKEDHT